MDDDEIVVVIGSGEKFHAAFCVAYPGGTHGPWHTVCGTGFGRETTMTAIAAWKAGWRPCERCFGEEPMP